MPLEAALTRLTSAERALGLALLGGGVAALGTAALGLAGWGPDLGVAGPGLLLALGGAGLLAGVEPRWHRPLAWPVVLGLTGLGGGALLAGRWALGGGALALALGVLGLLGAAVRSVNGGWLRGGPPGA